MIRTRQTKPEPEPNNEALPDPAPAAEKRGVGRPASGKIMVTMRLDPDVVEKFKATGKGWQARMNDVLRKAKL